MSFGFSPADIITGLRTCNWLLENCFDKNNAADVRYRQFENDVHGLSSALKQLSETFNEAFPYEQPIAELKDVVGDFFETLEECKRTLQDPNYVNLQRSRPGFILNVRWASGMQSKVDQLRSRIQFHTSKVQLVIEPMKLGISSSRVEMIEEMLAILRSQFPPQLPLAPIPTWLDIKLGQASTENPPVGYTDIHALLMHDQFDLLHKFFQESSLPTIETTSSNQAAEKYLSLLKTQWILERIKEGQYFQQAPIASLFRWTIAGIEQKVVMRHRRPGWTSISDADLQMLPQKAFLIWPQKEDDDTKEETAAEEDEEEILRLSAPNSAGLLEDHTVLFRKGPMGIRIARRVRREPQESVPNFKSEYFNPHVDRFVPYYTIEENTTLMNSRRGSLTLFNAAIYRGNETGETVYSFERQTDIWDFQHAITGYRVVHDVKVNWMLNRSIIRRWGSRLQGRSKMQIWHWKPLTHYVAPNDMDASSQASGGSAASLKTFSSTTSTVIASTVMDGIGCEDVRLDEQYHTAHDITLVASRPPLPAIVVFARLDGQYVCIQVEMHHGLDIDPSACRCRVAPAECLNVVIQPKKKSTSTYFIIRKIAVQPDRLNEWNLSIIGQPRHPRLNSDIVEKVECKFLNLEFDTMESKKTFIERFQKAIELRDRAAAALNSIRSRTQYLAEDSSSLARSERSRSIYSTSSSNASLASAPRIGPLASTSSLHLAGRF